MEALKEGGPIMANTKKNYNKISAEKVEKEVAEQIVDATEPIVANEWATAVFKAIYIIDNCYDLLGSI